MTTSLYALISSSRSLIVLDLASHYFAIPDQPKLIIGSTPWMYILFGTAHTGSKCFQFAISLKELHEI
jgi:hypothetical protein